MAIVYRHRRLDNNEIFYIGIGKSEKRAYCKDKRNNLWLKIKNKTSYEVEIIATNLSWDDACELEIFLIEQYGRKDLGTGTLSNLTDGGDGALGWKASDETKAKMKASSKRGKDHHNYGTTISAENQQKMINARLNSKKERKLTNPIIVLDLQTGVFYNSVNEASKYSNYSKTHIKDMLNGKQPNKTSLIKT